MNLRWKVFFATLAVAMVVFTYIAVMSSPTLTRKLFVAFQRTLRTRRSHLTDDERKALILLVNTPVAAVAAELALPPALSARAPPPPRPPASGMKDVHGNSAKSEPSPVPAILHQTYVSKARVPPKVAENLARFAPTFERRLYDDADAVLFLKTYFQPVVLECFQKMRKGPHKADLLRYALLYVYGGVYMDIKTELIQPLSLHSFPPGRITTVIAKDGASMYQGIIGAPPRHPLFLELLEFMLKTTRGSRRGPNFFQYHMFTRDFFGRVQQDLADGAKPGVDAYPHEGASEGERYAYHLLSEACSTKPQDCEDGLDRYGLCCNVYESGDRFVKTRYADYPW